MTQVARANVFSVAPGAPFLDVLAEAFLAGRLTPTRPKLDALSLADATIYLPTRRATRQLAKALLEASGAAGLLLPRVAPLGEVAEEEASALSTENGALAAAVGDLERRIVLADIAREWAEAQGAVGADDGFALEPVPRSPGEAVAFAGDLARLFDEMLIEGVDGSALHGVVPEDLSHLARNWQINLSFLSHALARWSDHLAGRGLVERVVARDAEIRRAAQVLKSRPLGAPVIAAGSTGSVPATAELLAAIVGRADGAVVLPGLDLDLDGESWERLEPDHPQFGMKRLLEAMGIDRGEVIEIGEHGATGPRRRLVSEIMRPAATAELWAERLGGFDAPVLAQALGPVSLVAAHDEHEEARVIALAMREAAERENVSVALVTPDRGLARRVVAELGRWGLAVDDSAGRPLALSPPALLLRHLLGAVTSGFAPLATLALLKHPLVRLGMAVGAARHAARALELAALRGGRPGPGIAGLEAALAAAERVKARHPVIRRLGAMDFAAARELVARLRPATATLAELTRADAPAPADRLLEALIVAAEAVAGPESGAEPELWRGEAGEALALLLAELAAAAEQARPLAPSELGSWLDQLMVGRVVRARAPAGGRIAIWGPLEARLQTTDRMILGGLNEGVWPPETETDPWLGRHMRAALGFDPPERRIGLAAHDFDQGLLASEVILTRAQKSGGTPTVPSRWIWRLQALLKGLGLETALAPAEPWLAWARGLDHVAEAAPLPPPQPKPPVAARPLRLSVTQIETLIRDPYAIYAREVLGLAPLEAPDLPPNASDQGLIIHHALAHLMAEFPEAPLPRQALDRLLEIGKEAFAELDGHPGLQAYWWTRFGRIARWFVAEEAIHRPAGMTSHTETQGMMEIAVPGLGAPFRLNARADRIDIDRKDRAHVVDYKTGNPPSAKQIARLMAPQLPLEAAMVAAGAFGDVGAHKVASLCHVALSGRGEAGKVVPAPETPAKLAEKAMEFLAGRLALFANPETAYASRRSPFREELPGRYDHLARVGEWSVGLGRRHDG